VWQFNNTSWEQDGDSQAFKLKYLYGKEYTSKLEVPLEKLIGAKKHKIANTELACSHGVFPAEFSFCPFCRSELSAAENHSSLPWIPPYGNGSGQKILPKELKSASMVESKGQSLMTPSMNGRFSFCSVYFGAQQRLLIALQRDIGKISVCQSSLGGKWSDLDGKVGEDNLPEWSWSLATDTAETGLAIPSIDGPAWVTIDWTTGKLKIDRGEGRSVGGIVKLGKFLLAPVLRGDNFFMLYRKDGDIDWSECKTTFDCAVIAPQLIRTKEQHAFFGVPVVDDSKMVAYWPCRGGYVKVRDDSAASDKFWEFRPWETDEYPATALIELGPPYRKTGSRSGIWQLCEDYDPSRRDGVVYKIIKFDGDERADSEVIDVGQFVSTGRASFSWLYDSWNDVHKPATNVEQIELRYPLLQFGDKGLVIVAKVRPWERREDMGLFSEVFFNPQEKTSVFVRFVLEGDGFPEKALYAQDVVEGSEGKIGSLFKLSLAQLPELSVFVHDTHIHIYFPENNKCYSWPLELTES
jgi:hypothetical protein